MLNGTVLHWVNLSVDGVTYRDEFPLPQRGGGGGVAGIGDGWGMSVSVRVDVEWNGRPLGHSE